MTDYMLTANSSGLGWRDIAVINAPGIREAISVAEAATGCLVSHGRGHIGKDFDPAVTIDAATGDVTRHHDRGAKPIVQVGPPDVLRAIAQALAPAKKPARRD